MSDIIIRVKRCEHYADVHHTLVAEDFLTTFAGGGWDWSVEDDAAEITRLRSDNAAMSDKMGDTDGIGLIVYQGNYQELQRKLRVRDDKITRLRADKAALVEALEEICDATLGWDVDHTNARAALAQAKSGEP